MSLADVQIKLASTAVIAHVSGELDMSNAEEVGATVIGATVSWVLDAFMWGFLLILELIGAVIKPFALMIRLFANMIAGHVIILALIGLIFMMVGWTVFALAPLALFMALFIMVLEILVAFIQAFIFSLLAAVFIGAQAPDLQPTDADKVTAQIVARLLEHDHIAKPTINDEVAKKWARNYIKTLDPLKYYFLKADVDEFLAQDTTLDEKIQEGNIDWAKNVFERFLKRSNERLAQAGDTWA